MEDYAAALGVKLVVRAADADYAQQSRQFDELLFLLPEVIILAPQDSLKAAELASKASEMGIPVIAYDRLILGGADVDLYISFDNYRVGQLQGNYIADHLESGKLLIIRGAASDRNSLDLFNGEMSVIQSGINEGRYQVLGNDEADNWLPTNAFEITYQLLSRNMFPDAVIAPNDGTAGGVVLALKQYGLDGRVLVTGQDAELSALRRIRKGTQQMTVFKDSRALARTAIEQALLLANGITPVSSESVDNGGRSIPVIYLKPSIINSSNLNSLVNSGYISKGELYGR